MSDVSIDRFRVYLNDLAPDLKLCNGDIVSSFALIQAISPMDLAFPVRTSRKALLWRCYGFGGQGENPDFIMRTRITRNATAPLIKAEADTPGDSLRLGTMKATAAFMARPEREIREILEGFCRTVPQMDGRAEALYRILKR